MGCVSPVKGRHTSGLWPRSTSRNPTRKRPDEKIVHQAFLDRAGVKELKGPRNVMKD